MFIIIVFVMPTKINNRCCTLQLLALLDKPIDLWLSFYITMDYVTVRPPITMKLMSGLTQIRRKALSNQFQVLAFLLLCLEYIACSSDAGTFVDRPPWDSCDFSTVRTINVKLSKKNPTFEQSTTVYAIQP
jgi:hypothetical protein